MIEIKNLMPGDLNNYAVSIINHDIYQDHRNTYENIIQQMDTLLKQQIGFLSVDVLRPYEGSTRYIIILYFNTEANANAWLESEQRHAMLAQIKPWLIHGDVYHIQTNLDFWFNPKTTIKEPKTWKKWIAAWLAVVPLALVIPVFYIWLFENILHWSMLMISLPISATISFFMTYFSMPFVTHLLSNWLSK